MDTRLNENRLRNSASAVESIADTQLCTDGFMVHPRGFPVECRLLRWGREPHLELAGDMGLTFHSGRYMPAGSRIRIGIPLRGALQQFEGTVVLVKEAEDGFQIGLWFSTQRDAHRAKLVETICYTEMQLKAQAEPSPLDDK